jgi:hypothetical protein
LSINGIYLSISLHTRRKSIVFYSRKMATTRSDELRHSPAARDTKSSSAIHYHYFWDFSISFLRFPLCLIATLLGSGITPKHAERFALPGSRK